MVNNLSSMSRLKFKVILAMTIALNLIPGLIPCNCVSARAAQAETEVTSSNSLTHMPVKEITVFKDGHALLVHEGEMPLTANGSVMLEDLPRRADLVIDLDSDRRL